MRSSSARNEGAVVVVLATAALLMMTVGTAEATVADDPVPQTLTVQPALRWTPCVAGSAATCPELVVDFAESVPASITAGVVTTPPPDWVVQSLDLASRATTTLAIREIRVPRVLTGLVVLVLDASTTPATLVDPATHLLTVTYLGAGGPTVVSIGPPRAQDTPGLIVDASDPEDADLYFSGKLKATEGDGPLFSFAARLRRPLWTVHTNEFGAIAEVTAEEQGNVDPDAIKVGATYARVLSGTRAIKLSTVPFGGEFSRDEPRTAGLVSSGDITWTAIPTLNGMVAVDLVGGLEVGRNLKNALNEDGSGRLTRVTFGVNGYARFSKIGSWEIKELTLTASWLGRALARSEIDPERLDAMEQPTLTKRTRHRVAVDLSIAITKRLGIAAEFRRGPLPPAFELVKPTVSLSLTYKADWRKPA